MKIEEEKILVSSHGYADANIFFLQGYPLREDLENGLALSGFQERFIDDILHQYKLNLKECYRSAFIKEQLEYSGINPKKLRLAMSKLDINKYESILFDEIKYVKPNIIVPLDDIALRAVFTHLNEIKKPKGRKYWINCYRGSILPVREDWQAQLDFYPKIIPTIGPQYLFSDWTARSYISLDYRKIVENQYNINKVEDFGKIWVARRAEDFQRFLERSYIKDATRLSFDIETYNGLITCISFTFDGIEAVTVPMLGDKTISNSEEVMLWRLVSRVLRAPIAKNNQNIKYDWTILERHGFHVENVESDTMLKGHLLYPELPKGLDFYTSIYTPISYYKDEGKEFNPKLHSRDRLYIYCSKDALAAHISSIEMDKELEDSALAELYNKEINPLILIYKNIDETGIRIDDSVKHELNRKYSMLYNSNLLILRNLIANPHFNPKSNPQVGELIYNELKFPVRYKISEDGNRRFKCDKETLDDLLINFTTDVVKSDIISRIILARKLAKVTEYINTPLRPDGRFCSCSNLAGTESGRTSFSKTIDEIFTANGEKIRIGRSLQTITKHGFKVDEEIFEEIEDKEIAADLRSMFVPTKDFVFIEVDGSQAEARVVAVLCEDYDLLAQFDLKPNIHQKTASLLFGISAEQVFKDRPFIPKVGVSYYHIGKITRHAGNNNIHKIRLSQISHLPVDKCQEILTKFHQNNPKIREIFHKEIKECLIKDSRILVTPFGRRRQFLAKYDDYLVGEAIGYIQQSTVSDLTKFSLHRIVTQLKDHYIKDFRFLNESHDSFLAEVSKDFINKYIETAKLIYERKFSFINCSLSRNFELSIPCEIMISDENWMNMKEFKV